jgi:hypothetical protein
MPGWEELDQKFQALAPDLRHHNLQFQWGPSGTDYRHYLLSGTSASAMRRFEVLAGIAGRKLEELPPGTVNAAVFERAEPTERWYEVLRHHAGAFTLDSTVVRNDESWNPVPDAYLGHISRPAEASATVALQLSSLSAPADDGTKVTSVGQSGGITANTVNFAPPPTPPGPRTSWWKSTWALVFGVAAFLAAVVTVLQYFGATPFEKHIGKDNRTSVTSINQQGGITADTVNIGAQPRHMNAQLGAQLQQLVPTAAKVSITAVMGDQEAFAFAQEVREWMGQNGYANITPGVNQTVFSHPVRGQNVNKTADGFDIVIGGRQ